MHNALVLTGCWQLLRRENIEKDIEREKRQADEPDKMEEDEADPVPCITRAHFEEVRTASALLAILLWRSMVAC